MKSIINQKIPDNFPKSKMVEILGQKGVEGFVYEFGVASDNSGASIGNGIDFKEKDRKFFKKLNVPDYLLDKLDALQLYGLKGDAAKAGIKAMRKRGGHGLTEGEIHYLSNKVTERSSKFAELKLGKGVWKNLSENIKAVATSLVHPYENEWLEHNSFAQIKKGDWFGLKKNMENYGDKSKGVNNRHRIMSKYVDADMPTLSTDTDNTLSILKNVEKIKSKMNPMVTGGEF